ncbi:MAG: alanyl-tRNA editing protein [Bacillota bacterium]|jgi:alanyl-tRNA synthetase
MKTNSLYYQDAYLHTFTARVVSTKPGWVELDQTAFYPEGGGQPGDRGWINGVPVTDTQVDEHGTIWHRVERELEIGSEVKGQLDWVRRFDHMQQHSGQHVLSQAFWQLYGAATVGFHLGVESVTIDVDNVNLSDQQLQQAESLANAVIRSKRPVVARFVAKQELPLDQLRKLPKVEEDIRLVAISGFDLCPCGGTHVRDLGDVGLLKLLGSERRKHKLRISFIAGHRAYHDYRQKHQWMMQLSAMLSEPIADVVAGTSKQLERVSELEKEVKTLRTLLLQQEAQALRETAESIGVAKLVWHQSDQRSVDELKELAALLTAEDKAAAVLALPGESYRLVVGINPDLGLHAGQLLQQVVKAHGGKGGGAPHAAQGMVPEEAGHSAFQQLKDRLSELLSSH